MVHRLVDETGEIEGGMEEKSQQQQCQEEGCEVLLTMAIVVFEVVAPVLEDIEAFILHLPAAASICNDLNYALLVYVMVSSPTAVVKLLSGGLVDNGQLTPVDPQGVGGVRSGNRSAQR